MNRFVVRACGPEAVVLDMLFDDRVVATCARIEEAVAIALFFNGNLSQGTEALQRGLEALPPRPRKAGSPVPG